MKLIALLVISVTCLAGCISFPKTHDDFRAHARSVDEFVVPLSIHAAYDKALENASRCYNVMWIPGPTNTAYGKFYNDHHAVVWIENSQAGIGQLIDIESIDPTHTKVSARYLSSGAASPRGKIKGWFHGSKDCM